MRIKTPKERKRLQEGNSLLKIKSWKRAGKLKNPSKNFKKWDTIFEIYWKFASKLKKFSIKPTLIHTYQNTYQRWNFFILSVENFKSKTIAHIFIWLPHTCENMWLTQNNFKKENFEVLFSISQKFWVKRLKFSILKSNWYWNDWLLSYANRFTLQSSAFDS